MTAFVQAVVILSTKYIVLHCFDSDMNGTFVRTQQRGEKLLERLWQDIDRFEPEQLLTGFTEASKVCLHECFIRVQTMLRCFLLKKTKVKSKELVSTSESKSSICTNTSLDLTQHTQQSILNEPRVQLAILVLIQMLLVVFQLLLSAFVLNAWEMIRYITRLKSSFAVIWSHVLVLTLCFFGGQRACDKQFSSALDPWPSPTKDAFSPHNQTHRLHTQDRVSCCLIDALFRFAASITSCDNCISRLSSLLLCFRGSGATVVVLLDEECALAFLVTVALQTILDGTSLLLANALAKLFRSSHIYSIGRLID